MATRRTTGSVRAAQTGQPAAKAAPRQRAPALKPEAEANANASTAAGASTGITVSEEARRAMIQQAAYLRAERRGFPSGGEVEDWLAAEAEVDALLRAGHSGPPQ